MRTIMPSQNEGFWTAVESELLACLRDTGPMTPAELGQRLGMSAAAAASLAAMLAVDRKLRICLVELDAPTDEQLGASRISGNRATPAAAALAP